MLFSQSRNSDIGGRSLSASVLTAKEAVAALSCAEPGASESLRRPAEDTFPKIVLLHGQLRGNHPSMREKEYGIWQTYSWSDAVAAIRAISCGLAAQGLRRG